MAKASFTDEDDALLADLGVEVETKKKAALTPRQERIIAGFEDIQRFHDEHGRAPGHGEENDIFERMYAVRLDRLRELEECRQLLEPMDHQNLLGESVSTPADDEELDDDALLAELGVDQSSGLTELKHVRSSAEKKAAEEIANRQRCEDFESFKPKFEAVQAELENGIRETRPFQDDARIAKGNWFILAGQTVLIAEEGEEFLAEYGRKDRRLRVIYSNGTESNMLKRSLERALQKDDAGRRITDPSAGPLFGGEEGEGDQSTGTIYVLRSKSDHQMVAEHRDLVHKIGVTNMDVKKRIAGARQQTTFLMADVEIVATYQLFNIQRTKLENLIHRVFHSAQLDIEIPDRFGRPVVPREWFLVPLFVIDEAVERIKDGTITEYRYDPKTAQLVKATRSTG